MYKIKVTLPYTNEVRVYISKWRASSDKVAALSYSYVTDGYIDSSEWAKSQQTIADRFSLELKETPIDGRTEEAKALPEFTWLEVISRAAANIKVFHGGVKP